jgi:LPXTG-site transpeptidase (sortase) family protein
LKNKNWRRWWSDLFILAGLALLFGAALFWAKTALAAQQMQARPYLVSMVDYDLPLPTLTATPSPLPTPTPLAPLSPTPVEGPSPTPLLEQPTQVEGQPTGAQEQPVDDQAPTEQAPTEQPPTEQPQGTQPPEEQPPPEQPIVVQPPATEQLPDPETVASGPSAPTETPLDSAEIQAQETVTTTIETLPPTPAASAGPIVRLVIPRLDIDRAVVKIGLVQQGGKLDWNTDTLFATRNRPDLVGQLAVSVNPGDGGNIVLVGHNYNNGGYNWNGVFVNLKALRPGDRISVSTQNGGEFHYTVQKVKQVPWVQKNSNELEKHQNYLWPKPHEQLTLVTCGGANLWAWQARVYVVALPAEN